jgi:hypothetical protein
MLAGAPVRGGMEVERLVAVAASGDAAARRARACAPRVQALEIVSNIFSQRHRGEV